MTQRIFFTTSYLKAKSTKNDRKCPQIEFLCVSIRYAIVLEIALYLIGVFCIRYSFYHLT